MKDVNVDMGFTISLNHNEVFCSASTIEIVKGYLTDIVGINGIDEGEVVDGIELNGYYPVQGKLNKDTGKFDVWIVKPVPHFS